jgi:hypothetical protein
MILICWWCYDLLILEESVSCMHIELCLGIMMTKWRWKSSNISLANYDEESPVTYLWQIMTIGVVPHSYTSIGESICIYMMMFCGWWLKVWKWCAVVICEKKRLCIITVESEDMVEIILSWYLFNMCVFPYYYVMAGFLTPYFVVLFYVWWVYLEYRCSGWQGVAMGRFRRWRGGDALCLVLLYSCWISM